MDSMATASFFGLIRDYLVVYLPKIRLSSPATIVSYRTTLNQLLDYVEQSQDVEVASLSFEDFNAHIIAGFMGWLFEKREVSPSTCNQRLAAVKAFFSYCAMRDPSLGQLSGQISQIKRLRTMASVPEIMSEAAYRAILDQADRKTRQGRRNLFILIILFETGVRISELLGIRLGDISTMPVGATITVIGKGDKTRTVVCGRKLADSLGVYLSEFHEPQAKPKAPLIYTIHKGEKTFMSSDTPQKFIKAYANSARLVCPEVPQSVHPHSFRHLRASTLYQSGTPLSIIARLLGHASIDTTAIYASADIEMLRAAVEGSFPDYQSLSSSVLPEQSSEIMRKISGLI